MCNCEYLIVLNVIAHIKLCICLTTYILFSILRSLQLWSTYVGQCIQEWLHHVGDEDDIMCQPGMKTTLSLPNLPNSSSLLWSPLLERAVKIWPFTVKYVKGVETKKLKNLCTSFYDSYCCLQRSSDCGQIYLWCLSSPEILQIWSRAHWSISSRRKICKHQQFE